MTLFLFNPCYVRTVKKRGYIGGCPYYDVILQLNHQKFKKLEHQMVRLEDVIVDNETLHDHSETSCLMWMHLYFREKFNHGLVEKTTDKEEKEIISTWCDFLRENSKIFEYYHFRKGDSWNTGPIDQDFDSSEEEDDDYDGDYEELEESLCESGKQYLFGDSFHCSSWSAYMCKQLREMGYSDEFIENVNFHNWRYGWKSSVDLNIAQQPTLVNTQKTLLMTGGWAGDSRVADKVSHL